MNYAFKYTKPKIGTDSDLVFTPGSNRLFN